MASKDGKKTGGRPKGALNKRTWDARAIADRLAVDPLELLLLFAKGDWKKLGYDQPTKTILTADGSPIEVDVIDAHLRQKSARDAVPFLYPQLKSVELSGDAGAAMAATLTQMLASAAAAKGQSAEPKPGTGT